MREHDEPTEFDGEFPDRRVGWGFWAHATPAPSLAFAKVGDGNAISWLRYRKIRLRGQGHPGSPSRVFPIEIFASRSVT